MRLLEDENEELKEQLNAAAEQAVPAKESRDEQDTGIEDLSITDLTQHDRPSAPSEALQQLAAENERLHEELLSAHDRAQQLLRHIDEDVIAPGVKEKIRDLQERMEKEKDESPTEDEDASQTSKESQDSIFITGNSEVIATFWVNLLSSLTLETVEVVFCEAIDVVKNSSKTCDFVRGGLLSIQQTLRQGPSCGLNPYH